MKQPATMQCWSSLGIPKVFCWQLPPKADSLIWCRIETKLWSPRDRGVFFFDCHQLDCAKRSSHHRRRIWWTTCHDLGLACCLLGYVDSGLLHGGNVQRVSPSWGPVFVGRYLSTATMGERLLVCLWVVHVDRRVRPLPKREYITNFSRNPSHGSNEQFRRSQFCSRDSAA